MELSTVKTEPLTKMVPQTIGKKIIINFNGVHNIATRDALNNHFRENNVPLFAMFKIYGNELILLPPEGKGIELKEGLNEFYDLYYGEM